MPSSGLPPSSQKPPARHSASSSVLPRHPSLPTQLRQAVCHSERSEPSPHSYSIAPESGRTSLACQIWPQLAIVCRLPSRPCRSAWASLTPLQPRSSAQATSAFPLPDLAQWGYKEHPKPGPRLNHFILLVLNGFPNTCVMWICLSCAQCCLMRATSSGVSMVPAALVRRCTSWEEDSTEVSGCKQMGCTDMAKVDGQESIARNLDQPKPSALSSNNNRNISHTHMHTHAHTYAYNIRPTKKVAHTHTQVCFQTLTRRHIKDMTNTHLEQTHVIMQTQEARHTHTHTHTHTHSHTRTHKHALSDTHPHTHTPTSALWHTDTHTHKHTLSHTDSATHTHTHTHHTHAHTHTYTHAHTHN